MAPKAGPCLIDGCTRLEEMTVTGSTGGLCSGHRHRKRYGLPMEPPLHEGLARRRSPKQSLVEAALAYGDAPTGGDGDEMERKLLARLLHAARVYAFARTRRNKK